jgi:hypothetical protein
MTQQLFATTPRVKLWNKAQKRWADGQEITMHVTIMPGSESGDVYMWVDETDFAFVLRDDDGKFNEPTEETW